jgi:DNA replication protein DnaC
MASKVDDSLKEQLQFLRLPGLSIGWDGILESANRDEPSYHKFLREVIAGEYAHKRDRARLLRLKKSGVPEHVVMETYPFARQPKLNKRQVLEIYDTKSYIEQNQHIALIGPTGVGKTGLAIAFLIHAINQGASARFIEFADLIDELYQAMADHSEKKVLSRYLKYDCLLIDEMGYCEVESKAQAGLLFRLLRQRRRCTIVTSNLGFSEWETFLKNPQLTAALLEKFTSKCHFINMLQCKSITQRQIPERVQGEKDK